MRMTMWTQKWRCGHRQWFFYLTDFKGTIIQYKVLGFAYIPNSNSLNIWNIYRGSPIRLKFCVCVIDYNANLRTSTFTIKYLWKKRVNKITLVSKKVKHSCPFWSLSKYILKPVKLGVFLKTWSFPANSKSVESLILLFDRFWLLKKTLWGYQLWTVKKLWWTFSQVPRLMTYSRN